MFPKPNVHEFINLNVIEFINIEECRSVKLNVHMFLSHMYVSLQILSINKVIAK